MRNASEGLTTPTLEDQTLISSAYKIHLAPKSPKISPPKERRAVYYERLAANRWNPLPTPHCHHAHRTAPSSNNDSKSTSHLLFCAITSNAPPSSTAGSVCLSVPWR
jgi:hypothetical protein